MKKLFTLLLASLPFMGATAQEIEITSAQAKQMIRNTSKAGTSVHDPSVVYEPASGRYYILGTMRGTAWTTDFQNWTNEGLTWCTTTKSSATTSEAFVTPAVTTVSKGGQEVSMPAFNAMNWSGRNDADWGIDGNMWAPDIIWNPTMQKWCMYQSINGKGWHSSIILLTSDNITGPYLYQGPVVITGFDNGSHSYKETDLSVALGSLSAMPSRYSGTWTHTSKPSWPHAIDPCVFYDADGKLWMVYGSWSGGLWMLELNEQNGLRDYDVTYATTTNSDPYFGTRVGGGYYVSGEGAYIDRIGDYYYLFVSYGGYAPDGGYEMRVFRSNKPNGPYKDIAGRSAVYDSYVMNYGTGNETRGVKIMGAYNYWGFMTTGETAQGHNSFLTTKDDQTMLVYHTKFNDGHPALGFHAVRVHQMFLNKSGWLVAAPFAYNGETTTNADIAGKQLVEKADVAGTYQILLHKYKMDYAHMEEVTPVEIELTEDGKVTGAYTGTWSVTEGTSYIAIKLGSYTYNGVIVEQQMDDRTIKAVTFSAVATNGVNVWGYKYRADYALAWQLNYQKMPVKTAQAVKKNIDLYGMNLVADNVDLAWTSSKPDVISSEGKYYPIGLETNTDVVLTAHLTSGNYFWEQSINVKAQSETAAKPIVDTWTNGIVAHYDFDDASALTNRKDNSQTAQLLRKSTTALPKIEDTEALRNGSVVHLNFGANGQESYVAIPNPLKGKELTNGATISFFVKRTDNNVWYTLFGCTNGTAKLFFTGNLYAGFNDGTNWLDINNPNTVIFNDLGIGQWHHVVITFSRNKSAGVTIYIDGASAHSDTYNGSLNGTDVTAKGGFNYDLIVNHLAACDQLFLGNGSFWGSADARFDDFIVYDRAISLLEMMSLNQMMDRADKDYVTDGIDELTAAQPGEQPNDGVVYDLSGRRVQVLKPGLYIKNGKKFFVK